MSHESNTQLLERAVAAIDLAFDYMEHFTSTPVERILRERVELVQDYIDHQDYESLYEASLPALEAQILQYTDVLADEARNELYGANMLPDMEFGDEY